MTLWRQAVLLAAALAVGTQLASAQEYDTAYVPFYVNVNATVSATNGVTQRQISATADQEAVLSIPLQKTDGIRLFGTQKQTNASAIVSIHNGKIILNLSTQSYKNAEVSLYTVNGKRILRQTASASNAANIISRPNLATGAYLLSVRGADGNAAMSRLTHSGGGLNISVAFGGENAVAAPAGKRAAKGAGGGDWIITVGASGYVDSTYTLHPAAGANALQVITLRAVPEGEYAVSVFAGAGASGSGSYAPGTRVEINVGDIPFGHKFSNWASESNGVIFSNANNATTTFIMPANAVTVKANFAAAPTYAVIVSGGAGAAGGGNYVDGAYVTISAGTAPAGQRFKNWTSTSAGVIFDDSTSATTAFTMPPNAVTVTANFAANVYAVTVISGTGGGVYAPGATVSISAGTPPPIYNEFMRWTSSNGDVVFANATSAATVFIMPSADVTVTAVFGLSDGKTYRTVKIGDQTWMAENLNYVTSSGSWCYENRADSCAKYGRLYDWETALIVCPAGWKLPSTQDWADLIRVAGGEDVAGKKLKATWGWDTYWDDHEFVSGNGTDDFGFSAVAGGNYDKREGRVYSVGWDGYWWTTTEYDNDMANRWYINISGIVSEHTSNKYTGFSVRCAQR